MCYYVTFKNINLKKIIETDHDYIFNLNSFTNSCSGLELIYEDETIIVI